MKHMIEKIFRWVIKKAGGIVIHHTPKEKVNKLIKNLYPYKTDKELIRLGPESDGGYLVPDDLEGIEACFSPGVGRISGFEDECSSLGMKLFLADKSVESINTKLADDKYEFLKQYIGITNDLDFITLDSWIGSANITSGSDLLLQMDIEGGEYPTLINISDSLMKRFRIMIIEFHSLQKLFNPIYFDYAELAFMKILKTHTCVHIHPNNYRIIDNQFDIKIPHTAEFTFLRNDRINSKEYQTEFPHPLDRDNHPDMKRVELPKNWHKSS